MCRKKCTFFITVMALLPKCPPHPPREDAPRVQSLEFSPRERSVLDVSKDSLVKGWSICAESHYN